MAERGNGAEELGEKEAREFGGRPAVFWHAGDEGTEEGASLHQQGIRIAASYFRYREADILSRLTARPSLRTWYLSPISKSRCPYQN